MNISSGGLMTGNQFLGERYWFLKSKNIERSFTLTLNNNKDS